MAFSLLELTIRADTQRKQVAFTPPRAADSLSRPSFSVSRFPFCLWRFIARGTVCDWRVNSCTSRTRARTEGSQSHRNRATRQRVTERTTGRHCPKLCIVPCLGRTSIICLPRVTADCLLILPLFARVSIKLRFSLLFWPLLKTRELSVLWSI